MIPYRKWHEIWIWFRIRVCLDDIWNRTSHIIYFGRYDIVVGSHLFQRKKQTSKIDLINLINLLPTRYLVEPFWIGNDGYKFIQKIVVAMSYLKLLDT